MFGNKGGRTLLSGERKQQWRYPMFTKTKLALAAVLVFGAASAVQASNENEQKADSALARWGSILAE
jgi:hypothetical protein